MTRMYLTNAVLGLIAGAAAVGASAPAMALEAFPQYPLGADTTYSAAVPPVGGWYGGLALGSARASTFRDAAGKSIDPNLKFKVDFGAAVLAYAWDTKIFGGRPITFGTLPFLSQDTAATVTMGPHSRTLSYKDATIGDMSIGQLIGWQVNKNWSVMAGAEVYLPSGSWVNNGFVSNGANYSTFYPQFRVSYHNARNDHFSFKMLLGIPTRNNATGYKSGKHVIVEGAYGLGIRPNLGVDIAFSGLKQITDDRGPGVDPATGNRSQVFSIGPQIRYSFGPHNAIQMSVKYLHEFGSRRYPQGNRLMVQFAMPLWISQANRQKLGL